MNTTQKDRILEVTNAATLTVCLYENEAGEF